MGPARKEPDSSTYSGRFAIRLRKLREKAGLTVPEVAKAAGVNIKKIYNWESGTHQPQIAILPLLAEAYGLKTTRSILPEK